MEASVHAVNTKSCLGIHSRRIFPSAGDLRKQSSPIGVRFGLCSTKRNNCLGLSLGSTSMERGGASIQSLSLCRSLPKARLVRAQAASGSYFSTDFFPRFAVENAVIVEDEVIAVDIP